MSEQSRDAPVGDAPEAGDGSATEESSDDADRWGDDGRPDDHLADVGCAGCVEVWDHLSERRAAERRAASATDGRDADAKDGRDADVDGRRDADVDGRRDADAKDGRDANVDGRREADATDRRGYSE